MRVRRIKVIVNPGAGGGRAVQRLTAAVGPPPKGVELSWVQSRSAGHLAELMHEAQCEELDAIALAGGDGTVQHALGGLGEDNPVPIGLLPVGSGNDFAVCCGVPRPVRAAMHVLLHGEARRMDLGVCSDGRRFCCVAGVGLDELALKFIYGSRLPRSKVLNVLSALRALAVYRPRPVRIAWEGGAFEGEVMFAAVTNTRSYGGGFMVTPDARVDDGALDLCIVKRTGRLRLLRHFPRILKGTHTELDEVVIARSRWVHIEADEALPVPLDGELELAQAPLQLRCEPAAVSVLVPARLQRVEGGRAEVARVA